MRWLCLWVVRGCFFSFSLRSPEPPCDSPPFVWLLWISPSIPFIHCLSIHPRHRHRHRHRSVLPCLRTTSRPSYRPTLCIIPLTTPSRSPHNAGAGADLSGPPFTVLTLGTDKAHPLILRSNTTTAKSLLCLAIQQQSCRLRLTSDIVLSVRSEHGDSPCPSVRSIESPLGQLSIRSNLPSYRSTWSVSSHPVISHLLVCKTTHPRGFLLTARTGRTTDSRPPISRCTLEIRAVPQTVEDPVPLSQYRRRDTHSRG